MFGNNDHDDAKTDAVSDSGQPPTTPPNEVVQPDPPAVTTIAADNTDDTSPFSNDLSTDTSDTDTTVSQPTTAPPAPAGPSGPEPGPSFSEVFSAGKTNDTKPPVPATMTPPTLSPTPPLEPPTFTATPPNGNALIDLKREALTKLSPLVDELEQPPDEKFRTLMMMIQASDDQNMVRHAYDTALQIEDEKERAQALLDIVNEINYFTQNPSPETDSTI